MKKSTRVLCIWTAIVFVLTHLFFEPPYSYNNGNHLSQRQLLVLSEEVVPDGHYVTLKVENQSLYLPIELNGDYVSFPCQGCTNCPSSMHLYTPLEDFHKCPTECVFEDSTCEDGSSSCRITVQGEFKGKELSSKNVQLEWNHQQDFHHTRKFAMNFICEDFISDTHTHGTLGMSDNPHSFIHQLHHTGKLEDKVFVMCFYHTSGHFTLGSNSIDRDQHDSPLVYTKRSPKSPNYYGLHIRRVYFGNGGGSDPLKAAAQSTMSLYALDKVDYSAMNGTTNAAFFQTRDTMTFLHEALEADFVTVFRDITGLSYDNAGFSITKDQFGLLPTIFLQLEVSRN